MTTRAILERPLLALSVRQPFAWLIVHGGKTIENRGWRARHRGLFLVHAAKAMTREEYEDAVEYAALVAPAVRVPAFADLERGGIVGAAELEGVLPPCHIPALASTCAHPWHAPDQFGFVLRGARPLPFRALRGELGFFNVAPMPTGSTES